MPAKQSQAKKILRSIKNDPRNKVVINNVIHTAAVGAGMAGLNYGVLPWYRINKSARQIAAVEGLKDLARRQEVVVKELPPARTFFNRIAYHPSHSLGSSTGNAIRVGKYVGPEIIAHELGHVPQFKSSGNMNRFRLAQIGLGLGGVLAAKGTDIKAESSKGSKMAMFGNAVANAGIGVGAASAAKILADEAGASARGMRYLKQMKALRPGGVARLGAAFGTYVLGAGTVPVISYLYHRDMPYAKPRKKKKK